MRNTILREMRINSGASLKAFCQKLGYKPPLISGIEHGRKTTWQKIQNELAAYYGVCPSSLFDLETGVAIKVKA